MNVLPRSSTVSPATAPTTAGSSVASLRVNTLAASKSMAIPVQPELGTGSKLTVKKGVLSRHDQLMIVTQLSIMLRAGVDLAEAVRSVAQRSIVPNIRAAMSSVYAQLEAGRTLSAALDEHRSQFGGVMVATVAAGEASGKLPDVLNRLSAIIRDDLRLRAAVRSAVSYPLVLLLVTSLVLSAMVFFVLPQFSGIYASSRAPTPAVTRLLLDSAELIRNYWFVPLIGITTLVTLLWKYLGSGRGRRQIDQLIFELPFTGKIWSSLLAGRMFRLQGAMLASGVPMLEVLALTKDALGNSCFAELISDIEKSIVNGTGVSAVLTESKLIPPGAADMISTAEVNGQLGSVLQTVGEFYESEGEQYLRDAVKIAEPAIIVVLGVVVGAIVLAVMLPLLDLSAAGGM